MSINLDLCKFETKSETSYGFKMYDDEGSTYGNCLEQGEYEALLKPTKKNDMLLIAAVRRTGDDRAIEMLNDIKTFQRGMFVNDNWYDWCPALRKALT